MLQVFSQKKPVWAVFQGRAFSRDCTVPKLWLYKSAFILCSLKHGYGYFASSYIASIKKDETFRTLHNNWGPNCYKKGSSVIALLHLVLDKIA